MKKKLNINAIAIIMIGRTKILRHESEIVIPSTSWFLFNIQPAKVGPIAGARPTAKPLRPIAVPRCFIGNI